MASEGPSLGDSVGLTGRSFPGFAPAALEESFASASARTAGGSSSSRTSRLSWSVRTNATTAQRSSTGRTRAYDGMRPKPRRITS